MANLTRNFLAGRMNKVFDQRVLPNGEYIDAMNIRMGSTENSEVGVIENTKGNIAMTLLTYIDGTPLSTDALCIGAIADSANETIYWFVHDSGFTASTTGKLDMIVSMNVFTGIIAYHIISTDDGGGVNTTLNFDSKYLITGVNKIENLIFFTDDYNAPRFFNTTRNYPNPISYIDQFSAESILVIKKPPTQSPTVLPIVTGGQQNYMDTRFICFAYRYRYADGEYSATSQWSEPAFVPQPFSFSINSFLNEGMVNSCNAAKITYNSGGPLVVGVDLLFKQANNVIIKVIEKLNKQELGLNNDTDYQYVFDNSKIFTILPESELLRLYDNVPRFAKAQTIMGNRLMYGNYVDGYNLIDKNGHPIKLTYRTNLITQIIGDSQLVDTTSTGSYSIDGSISIVDSIVNVDFSSIALNLKQGGSFTLDVTITHADFSGPSAVVETTSNVNISLFFNLSQDYTSVYQMATSPEFQEAVGTISNIIPVYDPTPGSPTPCDGYTFTDKMNCALPQNLDLLEKFASGITATGQPIKIITSTGSNIIGFQVVAMKYVDNVTTPTTYAYEYYKIVSADASYQEISTPRSLHSNRGYEIGIVYMDEFARSSTALVSQNNVEYVPCSDSDAKNSIQVIIPTTQIAPVWAKRYKFVIKPDQENYDTIFSSIFFQSPTGNDIYFLLEGENARKVEQGDRFIVKRDSNGPTKNCVYATVLEKEAKEQGFIVPTSGVTPPGGTYMKINPNSFSVINDPNAIVAPGTKTITASGDGVIPKMSYDMNIETSPGVWTDYTVPAGSKIKINVTTQRLGPGDGNRSCEKRVYTWSQDFISSSNYNNMQDWWNGDNIGQFVNNGTSDVGAGATPVGNQYYPALLSIPGYIGYTFDTNHWQWCREASGRLSLCISAVQSCGSTAPRRSSIILDIQVFRAENIFVFETEPDEALPDVFFENELSFEIDADGNHMGNVQNQDIAGGIPAIVNTEFFNCFSFGNGVESYKIRDSIVGRSFNLGNRVTTVSSQDYKETDRFADMTYSGIYNPETNLNKLNEFNSGLLNYKNLELSFGAINILDGRETDVLVLQEDKISYVLAGKNLLSDSAAGGAITSVPEVLGTQIARTEKYGISFNPESYVQWGYDRFFTDVKRGTVIQLQGNSYSNEQLNVISDLNMRTWFRDRFNASFATQKLGGFDPYMNEYVLTITDRDLPENPSCLNCGVSQTFTLSGTTAQTYCVDLSNIIGQTTITWNVISIDSGEEFDININYNGIDHNSGTQTTSGSFTFYKDVNYIDIANVSINHTGSMVISVTVNCPVAEILRIVEVVLTNNSQSGQTINSEYYYTSGSYVGSLQSNLVTFATSASSPIVSWYNIVSGYVGSASIPPGGSVMRLQTNKIGFDDFDFEPAYDKFRYLRSSTLYNNNSVEMNAMVAASSLATPILGGGTVYHADFIVPSFGEYLYLIWDFRKSNPQLLCYSDVDELNSCCDCGPCEDDCYEITVDSGNSPCAIYIPNGLCGTTQGAPYVLYMAANTSDKVCIYRPLGVLGYEIISGNPVIEIGGCGCVGCTPDCSTWYVSGTGVGGATISYIDCKGGFVDLPIANGVSQMICAITTPSLSGIGTIELMPYCGCCNRGVEGCVSWVFYNSSPTDDVDFTYRPCSHSITTRTLPPLTAGAYCCAVQYKPHASSSDGKIFFDQCTCRE